MNQSLNKGGRLVTLGSPTATIAYDLPFPLQGAFIGVSVRLDESAPWYNIATGQRSSGAEILQVLSTLTELRIHANRSPRSGTLMLDNFALGDAFAAPPSGPVEVRFATGDEGWRVHRFYYAFASLAQPAWNSAGFIEFAGDDDLGALRWVAPRSVLGNRSTLYDGTLSFDAVGVIDQGNTRVALAGGGHMLYHPAQATQRSEPVQVSVRLNETDQWYDYTTGQRASGQQMREALADLTSLVILGKVENLYHTPSDFSLDNVLMQPVE